MERYSEYKDSGVKWLGEIPSHWEVMSIKYTGIFENGLTYSPADTAKEGTLVLRSSNIQDFHLSFKDNVFVKKVSSKLLVRKGDIIICSRNGSASLVGKCALVESDIEASFGAFMMRYRPVINPKYAYYLFQGSIGYYKGLFSTTTINQLTKSILNDIKVAIPNLEEQVVIGSYLDAATSKIDKAIAMQQKMIDLLNERKKIIIQNAVTKGLDENVEMKDSGVEWIGMIPKHWKIIRIKHLAKLQSGSNLTSNEISDTGSYPVYGGNGLRGFYGSYNCEGSYVLIGRQGALCGNINYAEDKFWATEHAVVCYPKKKYNTLWFGEVLRLMDLGQYSLASAQPGLAVERIKGLYMPYPSIEEQNKIALFLKQNIGKIDLYARHCQRQITLLQERKQIIINEVVTGKVKVS